MASDSRGRRKQMKKAEALPQPADDFRISTGSEKFSTVLADPPWRFINRTGKVAPEHHRLSRYGTMSVSEISKLPISSVLEPTAHLYLWVA